MKILFPFWQHIPLRAQVFAGFLLPLAMVAGLSWVVRDSLTEADALSAQAERSIRGVAVRGELLKAVLDAETGERGYIITGNSAFLEPYRQARSEFERAAQQWRALENEAGLAPLPQVEKLFASWLEQVAEPAVAARQQSPGQLFDESFAALSQLNALRARLVSDETPAGDDVLSAYKAPLLRAIQLGSATAATEHWLQLGFRHAELEQQLSQWRQAPDETKRRRAGETATELARQLQALSYPLRKAEQLAADMVASGRGRQLVDEIRDLVGESIALREQQHTALAASVTERMQRVERLVVILPVLGVGLGLALFLLMQLGTIRSIERLRLGAERIEEGDLSVRVDEVRADELGTLGRGFNRMAAQLQLARQEATYLDGLQSMLVSSNSEQEAYAASAKALEKLLPDLSGALYLLASSRDYAECGISWGDRSQLATRFHPDECRALRIGRSHHASRLSTELFCPHADNGQWAFSLCIPLVSRDEVLGTLFLAAPASQSGDVSDHELALATTVAERLALALSNLRLTEKLRRESVRDPLTGLYNRRYLEETFSRELARVQRTQSHLAVIALDVDHFKRFNDSFGHEAGDHVLKELAAKMTAMVRAADIACRFGGEEFLMVLPDTDLDTARQRAEQLRRKIAELELQFGGKPLGSLTLSLGVAVFPQHANSKDELLRLADAALYVAKRQGRNRVVVSGEEG